MRQRTDANANRAHRTATSILTTNVMFVIWRVDFPTRAGSVPVCPWGSNMNCQHMAPCAVLGWIFGRMYARWCTRQMVSDAAKLFDSRVAVA